MLENCVTGRCYHGNGSRNKMGGKMIKENIAISNPDKTCMKCLCEKEKINQIHIGALGYMSGFDNMRTQVNLCNDCIKETNKEWWKLRRKKTNDSGHAFDVYEYEDEIFKFIKSLSLAGQELFWNHYSYGACADYDMVAQDWIDFELGILPHEKCKEYGFYSPLDKQSYSERFTTCQYPANRVWSDSSKGSWCPFGANGDYGQKVGLNISDKCTNCKHYKKRNTPITDIKAKDFSAYKLYVQYHVHKDKLENMFADKGII